MAPLVLVIALLVATFAVVFVYTYTRYRGKRLIICPENHETAAVDVDARHAAAGALFRGDPALRLSTCSRWPEKSGCGQECLGQIAASPDECLVQSIVATWYAGKRCEICRRAVGRVVWHERPPALLAADGTTHEWTEMRPEELPKIFATHRPICWPCHLAAEFRREHSPMVVERQHVTPPVEVLNPTTAVY